MGLCQSCDSTHAEGAEPVKKLPYYRLWVKDFETDENVKVLDFSELGLYLSCLNHSWVNEGLPVDPDDLRRAMKATPSQFNKMWPRVSKCFQEKEGRLVNKRQEEERESARRTSESAAKSAHSKWNKRAEELCERNANASNSHTERNASAIARPSECVSESDAFVEEVNLQPETKTVTRAHTVGLYREFAPFWESWCALTGRRQRESIACQAWISVVTLELAPAAMACLKRYGSSDEVARGVVTNPDRWIYDQARDKFAGEWQARVNGTKAGIAGEMERYLNEH